MTQEQINKQIFARLEKIERIIFESKKNKNARKNKGDNNTEINFGLSERAFMKKYGKDLSGPKKFVLLLAYFVKGKIGEEISIEEVKKKWEKMTSLCGGKFNTYYSTTAKDNNWADSKKYGVWFLTKDWKEIFA